MKIEEDVASDNSGQMQAAVDDGQSEASGMMRVGGDDASEMSGMMRVGGDDASEASGMMRVGADDESEATGMMRVGGDESEATGMMKIGAEDKGSDASGLDIQDLRGNASNIPNQMMDEIEQYQKEQEQSNQNLLTAKEASKKFNSMSVRNTGEKKEFGFGLAVPAKDEE